MRCERQNAIVWACALLVVLLHSSRVSAQQTSKDPALLVSSARVTTPAGEFSAARGLMIEGKWQEAEKLLKQSDLGATDPALSAAARHNLGYCVFQRAKALAETKPGEALPLFRSAASAYRAALDVASSDTSAAQGLEISRIWIKKLEDQQRQNDAAKKPDPKQGKPNSDGKDSKDQSNPEDGSQPKSQSKDHPSNPQNGNQSAQNGSSERDQRQALQDLAKDQQNAANESRAQSSKPPESAAAPSAKEMQDRQRDLTQRTQEAKSKLDSTATSKTSPKAESDKAAQQAQSSKQEGPTPLESLEEAANAQQRAEQALKNGDSESAGQHQREAARAIENAAERLESDSGKEGEKQASSNAGQESGKDGDEKANEKHASVQQIQQPKREIDPLAKQLLDREQRQRIQRQRWLKGQMVRPPTVEKDW